MYVKRSNVGFTMVEMMVVITIIGVLLSIVMVSISATRANARNKERLTDLASIALAFQLDKEASASDSYPAGSGEIGLGGSFDSIVSLRLGRIPIDPNATDEAFGYFYDDALCGTGQPGVYVQAFESSFDETGDCDAVGKVYTIKLP